MRPIAPFRSSPKIFGSFNLFAGVIEFHRAAVRTFDEFRFFYAGAFFGLFKGRTLQACSLSPALPRGCRRNHWNEKAGVPSLDRIKQKCPQKLNSVRLIQIFFKLS